jgi:hypothetical protein
MRRTLALVAVVIAVGLGLSSAAVAGTGTVAGTGDITKLVANNKADAVLVQVFGPGGECDVRYVAAELRGTDGVTYEASGGCYPGGQWILGLSKGTKAVTCGGDKLTYNAAAGFWRFSIPRKCLGRLTDKIKVSAELTFSATPGEAGPTKWLRRG